MKSVKITVTKEDIKNAQRGTFDRCPLALAMKRVLEPGQSVMVQATTATVFFADKTIAAEFSLPQETQRFVKAYDTGKAVFPWELRLQVVAKNF